VNVATKKTKTKKAKMKRAKKVSGSDGRVVELLDAVLEALRNLVIVQGYGAGLTKAHVRQMLRVDNTRVGSIWSQLQAAQD